MSQDLSFLREFVLKETGIVLGADKEYLIESRLMPVARKEGLETISDLVKKLRAAANSDLGYKVAEAMTTNETFFFRDKTPFDSFKNVVVPELLKNKSRANKIRLWCAAASTGQEPYSLSMCAEDLKAGNPGLNIEIVGTDISNEVLTKAKAGTYSQFEVQRGLPINYLLKYFKQTGEVWNISEDLKKNISFQNLNLLKPFSSLGKFDVIFCRNVLIYFDLKTKSDILARMRAQLADDGFLFLGASETVVGITSDFKPLDNARGVYVPAK